MREYINHKRKRTLTEEGYTKGPQDNPLPSHINWTAKSNAEEYYSGLMDSFKKTFSYWILSAGLITESADLNLIKEKNKQHTKSLIELEIEFNKLASRWKDETGLFSTTYHKIVNDLYFEIVALGEGVVTFILKDLQNNGPSHWHTALKALTKENPVSNENMATNKQIREAWIRWGKLKKLI